MTVLLASAAELNLQLVEAIPDDRAELLLGLASGLVMDVADGSAATWTDQTVPGSVKPIVLASASRAATNPAGLVGEIAGGYQVTYGSAAQAGVYLTPTEADACRRAIAGGSSGAISVPLSNRYGETLQLPT